MIVDNDSRNKYFPFDEPLHGAIKCCYVKTVCGNPYSHMFPDLLHESFCVVTNCHYDEMLNDKCHIYMGIHQCVIEYEHEDCIQ